MTDTDTYKSPSEFVETMLCSGVEANRLISLVDINNRPLFDAHVHTAINGFVAAMAMEYLRRTDPDLADQVAEELDAVFTRGDVGGPLYRAAKRLGHDPDQWIADCEQRAGRRKTLAT